MSAGRAALPAPADVGVIAALPIEVGAFVARLRDAHAFAAAGRLSIREGMLGEKLVVVVAAGPGRAAAERAAGLVLAGHRPRWLLSVGFAGALDPALGRGAVVVPGAIVDEAGTRLALEPDAVRGAVEEPPGAPPVLVTVDRIVRTPEEKAALRDATGAALVDMESLAVAGRAAERGVRFLAVRAISDDASDELPPEVLTLVGPTGGYRVGAAVGALMRRPGSLKDMFLLRERANDAARRLGAALARIIAALPG